MHRFKPFILTASWSLAVLVLSVLPGKKIPKVGFNFFGETDKLVHMLIYGLLAMMMGYEIHRRFGTLSKKYVLIIILLCSLYGFCLEGIQLFFLSDRSFEIADIIANIIGSFVGIEIVYFFYRQKQNL